MWYRPGPHTRLWPIFSIFLGHGLTKMLNINEENQDIDEYKVNLNTFLNDIPPSPPQQQTIDEPLPIISTKKSKTISLQEDHEEYDVKNYLIMIMK